MANENQTALATVSEDNKVTKELLEDYLRTTHKELNDTQFKQFVAVSLAFGLNPWKKEVHPVVYKNKNGGYDLSIVTGYEVYIKRAEMNPNYDGFDIEFKGSFERKTFQRQGDYGPYNVTEVVPKGDVSCVCTVYRKDRSHPVREEVFFDEYDQRNSMWKSKPRTMLKKVAIVSAFRKAFPFDLGGMPYTSDELPDNMTGADRLNAQGHVEVSVEEPQATIENKPEPQPEEKVDKSDPKAALLKAVKTYTTKQFASMLVMFKNENEGAHAEVVKMLHDNGWTKPNDVPSEKYTEIVELFYKSCEEVPF